MSNYKRLLVKLISSFATNLNNIKLLTSLRNTLLNSDLSDDLKVSINDSYIDATHKMNRHAKQNMLLILPEVQNRLADGYGLIKYHDQDLNSTKVIM